LPGSIGKIISFDSGGGRRDGLEAGEESEGAIEAAAQGDLIAKKRSEIWDAGGAEGRRGNTAPDTGFHGPDSRDAPLHWGDGFNKVLFGAGSRLVGLAE
jgi:hypothetical protein